MEVELGWENRDNSHIYSIIFHLGLCHILCNRFLGRDFSPALLSEV